MEILRRWLRADSPKTLARAAVGILQRAAEIVDPEILQRPALDPIAHLLQSRESVPLSWPKKFRGRLDLSLQNGDAPRKNHAFGSDLVAQLFEHLELNAAVARAGEAPRHITQAAVFFLEYFLPNLLPHEAQEGARFLDVFARFVDRARLPARGHAVDFAKCAFQFLARDPAYSRRQSRVGFQTIAHKRCDSCALEGL